MIFLCLFVSINFNQFEKNTANVAAALQCFKNGPATEIAISASTDLKCVCVHTREDRKCGISSYAELIWAMPPKCYCYTHHGN